MYRKARYSHQLSKLRCDLFLRAAGFKYRMLQKYAAKEGDVAALDEFIRQEIGQVADSNDFVIGRPIWPRLPWKRLETPPSTHSLRI